MIKKLKGQQTNQNNNLVNRKWFHEQILELFVKIICGKKYVSLKENFDLL